MYKNSSKNILLQNMKIYVFLQVKVKTQKNFKILKKNVLFQLEIYYIKKYFQILKIMSLHHIYIYKDTFILLHSTL